MTAFEKHTRYGNRYVTLQLQRIDGTPPESIEVKYPPMTPSEAASRQMRVSKVVENNINPEWNQEFVFDLPGEPLTAPQQYYITICAMFP